MGTTAHIHVRGPAEGVAHIYHRFDGDTLGNTLSTFIDELPNRPDAGTPLTPTAFATAWVEQQNQALAADVADLTAGDEAAADLMARFAAASIEAVFDNSTAHIDWHDYQYEVVLDADGVTSLAELRSGEPAWTKTYPS